MDITSVTQYVQFLPYNLIESAVLSAYIGKWRMSSNTKALKAKKYCVQNWSQITYHSVAQPSFQFKSSS